MKKIKTICQMCYFKCGLDVYVSNGEIKRVVGDDNHPVNKGTICPKGIASQQVVEDFRRLKSPLLRDGPRGSGKWKKISWERALSIAADKLLEAREEYGPESLAYHRGQAPGWVTTMNYVTRFMNTWGSPNLVTHAHLCFAPRAIAHNATYGGVPEPDFDNANTIVLWGFNPVQTSLPNYARRIIDSKEKGSNLIVIDPRFTKTAAKADLWLQPTPGKDISLALAMSKLIVEEGWYDKDFVKNSTVGFQDFQDYLRSFELEELETECGVPNEKIRKAARIFSLEGPSVLKEGNGLDQHINVVQAVRSIALLPALTGDINRKGSNILMPDLPFKDVQARGVLPEDWQKRSISRHPMYFSTGNALNDTELLDTLETGDPYKVSCLIVQGGDIVSTNSNVERTKKTLDKLDFILVHELYPTASTQIADLVLPAKSFLERNLLLYYRYRPNAWSNMVGLQKQTVPPVGDSKPDIEVILSLARRVGLEDHFPWSTPGEAFRWELEPLDITLEDLEKQLYIKEYKPGELYRSEGRVDLNTPSGKVEIVSDQLAGHDYQAVPKIKKFPTDLSTSERYPLLCGTGLKLGLHTQTQFHSLPWIEEIEGAPFLEIHPDTAEKRNITDGEKVKVVSRWGKLPAVARITEGIDKGVTMLAYGYGQPYATDKWKLSNFLTPDGFQDEISGATSNRRVPCEVLPWEDTQ